MAESKLAVLTNQCLDRRIPDKASPEKEVATWQAHRNKHHARADSQFKTKDARAELKRLCRQMWATRATRVPRAPAPSAIDRLRTRTFQRRMITRPNGRPSIKCLTAAPA